MLRTVFGVAWMLVAASTLSARIVQNTVTVTASASPTLPADQVNISLAVRPAFKPGSTTS
jgi:hypothetical protein